MSKPKLYLASFIIAILGCGQVASAAVVYLKWDCELVPQRTESGWRTGQPDLDQELQRYSLKEFGVAVQQQLTSDPVGLRRVLQLELEKLEEARALVEALRGLSGTTYAEIAPVRQTQGKPSVPSSPQTQSVPGDPLYGTQWFFPVMQAPAAWDLSRGDGVVVAVVDNGTEWQHPDLQANIWSNPYEIAGNGQDDDQNGFIDDVRGWDFVSNDNDPSPSNSDDYHGTHTAGSVAAAMDNGRGVVGMAPFCEMMPIKSGTGDYITYGIQGMIYAAHNGADVLSLSWGGSLSSAFEQDVVTDALLAGCLVVAAAGNSNSSTPHYPAAYDGVIAIGATDQNDVRAIFSNYGDWVSVCAPGVAIWSLIPGGYGSSSGTSMATPITAGVAALVKAVHPGWSAEQIRTQIISTADNIYPKNPLYSGMLGSGRVNAYRAVAETAPGLRVVDLTVTEIIGDGDGKIESGETAQLVLHLINEGATTTNVQVTLSSPEAFLQITQPSWSIPQFAFGETLANTVQPFEIFVSNNAPANLEATLNFAVISENFYATALTEALSINPAYANHDVGNVIFTLTQFGAYGYYDPFRQVLYGSGFRFPPSGSNALFHGSFLAGSSTQKVSDCAYGDDYVARYDWTVLPAGGEITMNPGTVADQEGYAAFHDIIAPPAAEQVGLEVRQHSYAWDDPVDQDYVIISFSLKNITTTTLNNLYAGLYMDWDVPYSYDNEAGWSADQTLGYVYNQQPLAPNTRYYGTALLTGDLASFRVVDLVYDLTNYTMTDSQKFVFMSAGMVKTQSAAISDQATILSVGSFSLASGDSVQVAFTVLGGEDLNDLIANAEAAQDRWGTMTNDTAPETPTDASAIGFNLTSLYPQPANGELTINYSLPTSGEVQLQLLDVQGRVIWSWKGYNAQPGSYRHTLNHANLTSGMYFLQGASGSGSAVRKLVWLK